MDLGLSSSKFANLLRPELGHPFNVSLQRRTKSSDSSGVLDPQLSWILPAAQTYHVILNPRRNVASGKQPAHGAQTGKAQKFV